VRVLAGLVVVVAACSFPGAGGPGDPDAAGSDPGESDAMPGADTDGDGVRDAADNCVAIPNAAQHDEDGDRAGDACDACPHIAAIGPHADGDGDGVGDACDPHPAAAGDALVFFDGFSSDGSVDAGWELVAGNAADWTIAGGALVGQVGEPAGILMRAVGAPGDRLRLATTADVIAIGPGATRSFALLADAAPSPLAFDFCGVSFDSQEIELYRYENGLWSTLETQTIAVPLGAYDLRSRTMDGTMCEVKQVALAPVAGAGVGTHVGLRVRNATVRFAYLAVYRSPPR
jgi:hypothetical protein